MCRFARPTVPYHCHAQLQVVPLSHSQQAALSQHRNAEPRTTGASGPAEGATAKTNVRVNPMLAKVFGVTGGANGSANGSAANSSSAAPSALAAEEGAEQQGGAEGVGAADEQQGGAEGFGAAGEGAEQPGGGNGGDGGSGSDSSPPPSEPDEDQDNGGDDGSGSDSSPPPSEPDEDQDHGLLVGASESSKLQSDAFLRKARDRPRILTEKVDPSESHPFARAAEKLLVEYDNTVYRICPAKPSEATSLLCEGDEEELACELGDERREHLRDDMAFSASLPKTSRARVCERLKRVLPRGHNAAFQTHAFSESRICSLRDFEVWYVWALSRRNVDALYVGERPPKRQRVEGHQPCGWQYDQLLTGGESLLICHACTACKRLLSVLSRCSHCVCRAPGPTPAVYNH